VGIKQGLPGVHFTKGTCRVLIWAPFSHAVILHNQTTHIEIPLDKKPFGYWETLTEKIRPGDHYMFSLDGGEPLPDPASLSQPLGVHHASEAIDLSAYQWKDERWVNPDIRDYVIYELHTGTFTKEGTFNAITDKLDHLKDLGINAIELMPVAQFPGERNWGYDGVFPYAVQSSYGGARALQQLVDTCHSKGFAVILDVVYNHLGPEGNYFPSYGPYFTDKYKTPWGTAINFDDAYCDAVRQFYMENALMWLRDFHIDALRLDAVHAIRDFSPKHIIQEMNEAVALLNKETASRKHLIAETDLNDSRFVRPIKENGYGLAAQWCDEFHHALRVCAGQERTGYYKDFKGIADLAKSMQDAYVYTGQYSETRHRKFGTDTAGITPEHFVVFAQNHDQTGNRVLGERLSHLVSFEMQKLMAAVVIMSPFVPLLFMGEEWGASAPFLYFTDHSDKELVDNIEKGRKEEFRDFATSAAPLPANDRNTFLRSKLNWDELHKGSHQQLFAYYKHLIGLRKKLLAVTGYSDAIIAIRPDEQEQTVVLKRTYGERNFICIFNFSPNNVPVTLKEDTAKMQVLLDSSGLEWGVKGNHTIISNDNKITVQPESAMILSGLLPELP